MVGCGEFNAHLKKLKHMYKTVKYGFIKWNNLEFVSHRIYNVSLWTLNWLSHTFRSAFSNAYEILIENKF